MHRKYFNKIVSIVLYKYVNKKKCAVVPSFPSSRTSAPVPVAYVVRRPHIAGPITLPCTSGQCLSRRSAIILYIDKNRTHTSRTRSITTVARRYGCIVTVLLVFLIPDVTIVLPLAVVVKTFLEVSHNIVSRTSTVLLVETSNVNHCHSYRIEYFSSVKLPFSGNRKDNVMKDLYSCLLRSQKLIIHIFHC
nr:MAG TPA_asm: hypothetical protein [Caudoviricetes sp.]